MVHLAHLRLQALFLHNRVGIPRSAFQAIEIDQGMLISRLVQESQQTCVLADRFLYNNQRRSPFLQSTCRQTGFVVGPHFSAPLVILVRLQLRSSLPVGIEAMHQINRVRSRVVENGSSACTAQRSRRKGGSGNISLIIARPWCKGVSPARHYSS